MRKKTALKKEVEKAVERLKEIEALAKEAELEEAAKMEQVKQNIDALCKEHNMFAGVVLTKDDLIAVLRMAFETKENIKIPFALYFNE